LSAFFIYFTFLPFFSTAPTITAQQPPPGQSVPAPPSPARPPPPLPRPPTAAPLPPADARPLELARPRLPARLPNRGWSLPRQYQRARPAWSSPMERRPNRGWVPPCSSLFFFVSNFGRTLAAVRRQLDLKLQPANALHGMQIGLDLAAKIGNMQVGRINLGVHANKSAGRMDLWCLFRAFFCPRPANRRLFCSSGLFGGLLELL
jgi:hypothetical protein